MRIARHPPIPTCFRSSMRLFVRLFASARCRRLLLLFVLHAASWNVSLFLSFALRIASVTPAWAEALCFAARCICTAHPTAWAEERDRHAHTPAARAGATAVREPQMHQRRQRPRRGSDFVLEGIPILPSPTMSSDGDDDVVAKNRQQHAAATTAPAQHAPNAPIKYWQAQQSLEQQRRQQHMLVQQQRHRQQQEERQRQQDMRWRLLQQQEYQQQQQQQREQRPRPALLRGARRVQNGAVRPKERTRLSADNDEGSDEEELLPDPLATGSNGAGYSSGNDESECERALASRFSVFLPHFDMGSRVAPRSVMTVPSAFMYPESSRPADDDQHSLSSSEEERTLQSQFAMRLRSRSRVSYMAAPSVVSHGSFFKGGLHGAPSLGAASRCSSAMMRDASALVAPSVLSISTRYTRDTRDTEDARGGFVGIVAARQRQSQVAERAVPRLDSLSTFPAPRVTTKPTLVLTNACSGFGNFGSGDYSFMMPFARWQQGELMPACASRPHSVRCDEYLPYIPAVPIASSTRPAPTTHQQPLFPSTRGVFLEVSQASSPLEYFDKFWENDTSAESLYFADRGRRRQEVQQAQQAQEQQQQARTRQEKQKEQKRPKRQKPLGQKQAKHQEQEEQEGTSTPPILAVQKMYAPIDARKFPKLGVLRRLLRLFRRKKQRVVREQE